LVTEWVASLGLILIGAACLVGLGAFGFVSLHEGEKRAARVAFGLAGAAGLAFFLAALLPAAVKVGLLIALGVSLIALAILFFWPMGRVSLGSDTPVQRFDERDILFARARLQPGSPEYEAYYAMRPENKASDERTRRKPGLPIPIYLPRRRRVLP
jgi:hypothetical protein